MLKKYNLIVFCFFVYVEQKHPPLPHPLNYASFVNTMERLPTYCVEKDFFCPQKSITSTFPLS